jgi:hypothetical protein
MLKVRMMEAEKAERHCDEVRAGVAAVNQLPDAINGWRFEAWKLHKGRGWDFYRAYDHVLVRYLLSGDARPLLDLILLQKRLPGPRVGEFIASITDGQPLLDAVFGSVSDVQMIDVRGRFRNRILPVEIRITENRGRGRPKVTLDDQFERDIRLRLVRGFCALAS